MASDEQKSDSTTTLTVLSSLPSEQTRKSPEEILTELLSETGSVSSLKLKSKLRENGHNDADKISIELAEMNHRWIKIDRSFFKPEKAAEITAEAEEESISRVDEGEQIAEEVDTDESPVRDKKSRRAKEKRLCEQYLQPFLSSLYYTDAIDENAEVAFCVQNLRPSTQFRNVDLIAVNWRDKDIAELVTVEAKLDFNSQVVQQAANYSRFSHRVWIAVVVEPGIEVEEIIPTLREENALLFEYVLFLGLGVIACQKAQGGSYNCYAVQWPRKQDPDSFEKQTFLECYRETFEQAGILRPSKKIGNVA